MKLTLLLVLCALFFVASAHEGAARLLVRKAPLNREVVLGAPLFITVNIYNVGDKDAHNVVFEERLNEEGFATDVGLTVATWDVIPSGQNVSHTYSIKPIAVGEFETQPAVVEYRDGMDGDVLTTYATDFGLFNVVDEQSTASGSKFHLFEWGIFSGLVFLVTFPPYYTWSKTKNTKKGKAARKNARK